MGASRDHGRPGAVGAVGSLCPRAPRSPARIRADRLRRGVGPLARRAAPLGATVVMLALLAGCVPAPVPATDPACAPPPVAAGAARVRPLVCSLDRVAGGEGRYGDWLLENAVARFVVRLPGAGRLTALEGDGGTLVDAVGLAVDAEGRAVQAGEDLLVELAPEGDRSVMTPLEEPGGAGLALPGFTWWLPADTDALEVRAADPLDAELVFAAGASRVGASARLGGSFVGVDAAEVSGEGWRNVEGLVRLGLSPDGTWPDAAWVALDPGAPDAVEAVRDGVVLARWERPPAAVADTGTGADTGAGAAPWGVELPPGARLRGARDGCAYAGLGAPVCRSLRARVRDGDGNDVQAQVVDGARAWTLPPGGGVAPLGPGDAPRTVWVWAGPAHDAVAVTIPAGGAPDPADGEVDVALTLRRAFAPGEGALLARYDVQVAPDAGAETSPQDARERLLGEGVGAAVLLADDEVPADPGSLARAGPGSSATVVVRAGSRTAGWITSWPWAPTSRERAHGAVPWRVGGRVLSALDQLAWAEGGEREARRTLVTAAWVRAARAEAHPGAWAPRPDAMVLSGTADIAEWVALLGAGVPLAPAGPRTWLWTDGEGAIAADQALLDRRSAAGTGPRVRVERIVDLFGRARARVTVDAAGWAGVDRVVLLRASGAPVVLTTERIAGSWTATVPWPAGDRPARGARWVAALATGVRADPWSPGDGSEPAWGLSAAAWARGE